ncbi:MAG: addiction module toxin, HicA family [Trueperaceae bacterium]|nr:MAG: addiction module toxin, HicA family [Trueperaceae bacterium]
MIGIGLVPACSLQHPPYGLPKKVALLLRLLAADGWVLVVQRGSHRQFNHPTKPGRVTVAGKPSDDLARGTLQSIMKQARVKWSTR